jgi:Clp amino terminal domain, pathogenicity island component
VLAPQEPEPFREHVEDTARSDDPLRALASLVELSGELETAIRVQVARALSAGYSFGDLARVLGISRQAAHRRYRGLAPHPESGIEGRLTAAPEALQVVRLARDEAVRRDAVALGSEHVLIAVLRHGGHTARLLHRHGVGLAAARAFVESPKFHSDRPPDPSGLGGGVRRILLEAMRESASRGERQVTVPALLHAALADDDGGARGVVIGLGASLSSLRRQLRGARRG